MTLGNAGSYQKRRADLNLNEIKDDRHPEREYDIICSNVENFKLYNDTFGVAKGDELLVGIAALSKERMARYGIYGRLGADRFMYLCERHRDFQEQGFEAFLDQINAMPQARGRVTLRLLAGPSTSVSGAVNRRVAGS